MTKNINSSFNTFPSLFTYPKSFFLSPYSLNLKCKQIKSQHGSLMILKGNEFHGVGKKIADKKIVCLIGI